MVDGVTILVALPAEARPLRRRFALQRRQPDGRIPLYLGGRLALAICGPGAGAATAAVAYLQGLGLWSDPAWLNIGIAGHADLPLGSVRLVKRVSCATSGCGWRLYPPHLGGVPHGQVRTLSRPGSHYHQGWLYDMEAAGLLAGGEIPPTRIQLLKVVSDNRRHSTRAINARLVEELIGAQLQPIERLVEWMLE